MIDHEMRRAIVLLREHGVSVRQISRQLKVARNSVKTIIKTGGQMPDKPRADRIDVDEQLLRDLYIRCDGYRQRIYEILCEEGKSISYPTLTRRVRELGLGKCNTRCDRVADQPGTEMQHDTSPYTLKIGGKTTGIVASLLYFRYCKERYLKFYRHFNRFRMKCFFHEALMHYGYAAAECIIDNTHLAVLRGTGRNALICPEMVRFLDRYGSEFIAHEIKHSNRKAGNERSFWTVETNFFPGREFNSLEDLNEQAFKWATEIMATRPQTEKKIVPNVVFEREKPYLRHVIPYLPRPYLVHKTRVTDQYGYAAFAGNYYWIPGSGRHQVKILEYANEIHIYYCRRKIGEYALPPDGVKGERITPPGVEPPKRFPNNQKQPSKVEENQLRKLGDEMCEYLDFIKGKKGVRRHLFVRDLHRLSTRGDRRAFMRAVAACLAAKVADLQVLENRFVEELNAQKLEDIKPDIDAAYNRRQSYLDGEMSEQPDLASYDHFLNNQEND